LYSLSITPGEEKPDIIFSLKTSEHFFYPFRKARLKASRVLHKKTFLLYQPSLFKAMAYFGQRHRPKAIEVPSYLS
jgi:hypothetical protein